MQSAHAECKAPTEQQEIKMAKRLSGNFTESENFGTSFDTADRNSGNKSRSNGNACLLYTSDAADE